MATQKAAFSIPSVIALIAAVLIFIAKGWFTILLLAGVAMFFGVIGLLLSLSSKVRGGISSFVGIGAGLIGIIIAIVKFVQWLMNMAA